MKIIARITYLVLALITKVLGLAFIVAAVLWLLGLFEVAGNTVLGLFVSIIVLAMIAGGLMEMIKKRRTMKAPCKGCEYRVIGCHSTCAAYIKYSSNRKEELETRDIRGDVYVYVKDNNNRIKRRIGKY